MIKYIVVTGASGWLGNHLIQCLLKPTGSSFTGELLKNAPKIHGVFHPNDIIPNSSILTTKIDITNKFKMSEFIESLPDEHMLFIHTAGVIHPKFSKSFFSINTDATRNIVDALKKKKKIKFIYISSNSPCGCNPNLTHLFTEQSPYNPYMNYGKSKKLAEDYINQQRNLNFTILRPPWFYGPNQPPRQTLFFKMIQNGGFPILGTGSQMRSMIYLDNLVQAIVKASLSQNSFQQTYWVADTQPYSMHSIIQTVKEILEENSFKTSSKQLRLPHFIGNIAQFCDYFIQAIGLYNQKIHVLSEMNKTIACSIEKATKEINYIPQISLKEGMDRSLKWCIKNNLFN